MTYRARLIIPVVALLAHTHTVQCQTLYLDSNGDGLNYFLEYDRGNFEASPDCVTQQTTDLDVYFVTDKNPDGTTIACTSSAEPLTIGSYQVLLRWSGGQVVANSWTDAMGFNTPNITVGDGTMAASGSDIWIGRAGESKPPGKYKLGTLSITVSGSPAFFIASSSTISPDAYTGFSSACASIYPPGALLYGQDFPTSNGFPTCYRTPVVSTTWGKIKRQYE
ncbi:MAG TPA: hypothetical protein VJX91_02180 [Candidatus Eisenbacteria bacterium]|nr:hypothetical protein [Candidatus Eisenbacteria bacterium]